MKTTLRPLLSVCALLLSGSGSGLLAQAIDIFYETSTYGEIFSGTQDVNNDGTTTAGSIMVDTVPGISGGTQNFHGSSRIYFSSGGTISGGTQNFYDNSSGDFSYASVGITGGVQNFQWNYGYLTVGISGGTQNFSTGSYLSGHITGGAQFFTGTSGTYAQGGGFDGGVQTISNASGLFLQGGHITGGIQYFSDTSSLALQGGNISGGIQYFGDSTSVQMQGGTLQGGTQYFSGSAYLSTSGATISNATLDHTDTSTVYINGSTTFTNTGITLHKNTEIQLNSDGATFDSDSRVVFDASSGGTGGTLRLSGHNLTVGQISSVADGGVITNNSSSGVLTVDFNTAVNTFGGLITDGGGTVSLGKAGTGTLKLTGANTYSAGTTVNGGTLVANGGYSAASSLGTGGVTVNTGGTLAGNDFIVGAVTINSGGHLSPGDPTGVLRFDGGLTLMGGSQVDIRLTDAAPTFFLVNGSAFNATDGMVTFNFTNGGFSASTLYTLVDFTNATSHDFTDLTHFTVGTVSNGTTADYTFELNGSLLQVMTSSAIPEPSTYAVIFGAGALGLVILRRRRLAA